MDHFQICFKANDISSIILKTSHSDGQTCPKGRLPPCTSHLLHHPDVDHDAAGGQRSWSGVRDLLTPTHTRWRGWWDFLLAVRCFLLLLHYSRNSPGIQLMANIKAPPPGVLERENVGGGHLQWILPRIWDKRLQHVAWTLIINSWRIEHSSNPSLKGGLFLPNFRSMTSSESHAGKGPMCLKHLGRSVFLISGSAVNSADQKVDQRLPGDRHLRPPPAEERERN